MALVVMAASATKNNIKIIGNSPWYAQGTFVYDSKGGLTVSHLRVSEQPVVPYLISQADLLAATSAVIDKISDS